MTALELSNAKINYLTNSLGEETGSKLVKEETLDWYFHTHLNNAWLQYLVELNDEEGILAVQEFTLPSDETADTKKASPSEKWQDSSSEDSWSHLESIAIHLRNVVEFEVLIGKETGFLGMHEICIFFPKNTEKKALTNTFEQLEEIKTLY